MPEPEPEADPQPRPQPKAFQRLLPEPQCASQESLVWDYTEEELETTTTAPRERLEGSTSHITALDQAQGAIASPGDLADEEEGALVIDEEVFKCPPTPTKCKYKRDPRDRSSSTNRGRSQSRKQLLYGGIPTDPAAIGLQLYAVDPALYTGYDKSRLGREIKNGHIKYNFTNPKFKSQDREKGVNRHLIVGNIDITADMIIATTKLNNIRNEYKENQDEESKKSKE